MRRLKTRERPDTLTNQTRKGGGNTGRRVYLILLILFALALGNYLFGDLFILRGDGLVLRDKTIIAAPYTVRIDEVNIDEGQDVKKGDVLMTVKSPEVLERLADLTFRQAELTRLVSDTSYRFERAQKLLPLAEKREEETGKYISRLEKNARQGFTTSQQYESALLSNYDATQDRIELSTETIRLESEVEDLKTALTSAKTAIDDLIALYADGIVTAAMSGSVGTDIPDVGSVYVASEPIMAVNTGESYVLTYLPQRYLFPIETGMEVMIRGGRYNSKGVVMEILPFSDALPQEFQNTFKPRDRSQLAKIRMENPDAFPLFEKVRITRPLF